MDSSHFQAPFEIHSFFSIFLPKVYHFTGCSTKKLLSKTKWKPEGILFVHTSFNATYRYMFKIAECLSAQLFRLKWFLLYTLSNIPYPIHCKTASFGSKYEISLYILSFCSPLLLSMLILFSSIVVRIYCIQRDKSCSYFLKIM